MGLDSGVLLINVAVTVFGVLLTLAIMYLYRRTRRVSRPDDLPKNVTGTKLSGIVTSVPDGDGFRFFHTPWLRSAKYTHRDNKLSVRLAGIDAPEVQGNIPGQPLAKESKQYLADLTLKKKVDLDIVGIDRYNRVLAFAYLRGWLYDTNINFEMVKQGLACVYVGQDAKYGGHVQVLRKLEEDAKRKKVGMWKLRNTVTPMEHKRIHRAAQKAKLEPTVLGRLWNLVSFWK